MTAAAAFALCIALQGGQPLPLYALPAPQPVAATTLPSGHSLIQAFQLHWLHSVEKIPWDEHWTVTPQGLQLGLVRLSGSGAGMEPPPEARLVNGGFEYSAQDRPPVRDLLFPDSEFTGPISLCRDDGTGCTALSTLAGRPAHDTRPIALSLCIP